MVTNKLSMGIMNRKINVVRDVVNYGETDEGEQVDVATYRALLSDELSEDSVQISIYNATAKEEQEWIERIVASVNATRGVETSTLDEDFLSSVSNLAADILEGLNVESAGFNNGDRDAERVRAVGALETLLNRLAGLNPNRAWVKISL